MHCSDCLRHVSFPARPPPSSSSSSVARAPRRRCPLQQIRSAFASACSVGMRCAASFRHSPAHSHAAAAQVFGVLLAFAAMQFTATLPLRRCSVYCWRLPQCSSQPRCRCFPPPSAESAQLCTAQMSSQHPAEIARCAQSAPHAPGAADKPVAARASCARAGRSPRARRARRAEKESANL